MNEQDVMRLVAEVVDKSTGTLNKIKESFKHLGEESEKAHEKGAKAARSHHKHVSELREKLEKAKEFASENLAPALGVLGITAVGVGEAFAMLGDKIKEAGEKYQLLNDTMKRGHASSQYVQAMGDTFSRLGMEAGKANDFIAETGETLDKLRRGSPEELGRLNNTLHGTLPWVQNILKGAHDYEEAGQRIMKALTDTHIPMDQRRKLAEALHLDPRIASKSAEEVREAIEKSTKGLHALNPDLLRKLDDAFTELTITQKNFWNDLVNTFGPGTVKRIETVTHAIEKLNEVFNETTKNLSDAWNAKPELPPGGMKTLPWYDLYHFWGLQRMNPWDQPRDSFEDRWSALKQKSSYLTGGGRAGVDGPLPISYRENDGEKAIERGVRQGVLDAFRELMGAQIRPGGGAGFQNASFTTSGGGGFGGGSGGGGSYSRGLNTLRSGAVPHSMRGAAGKVKSGDAALDTETGSGLTGSDYLKKRRERFAKELQDPKIRDQAKGMMLLEGTAQESVEALMNRMDYTHQSLMQGLHSGFYGPINRGQLPGAIAQLHGNPKLNERMERALNGALAGSDNIKGYTDQGMPTDPNGHLRRPGFPYLHKGGNDFTDWEGGPGGRRGSRAYREMIEGHVNEDRDARAAREAHGARLSDHIRHRNILKNAKTSGLMGNGDGGKLGHASVSIDLNGFPKGTRATASTTGLFKEYKLARGRTMMGMRDDD